MSNGCGAITWWGFSPSLHLINQLDRYEVEIVSKDEVNVLLVGAGDGRHIINTLIKSKSSTPRSRHINFFVVENCMEPLARQMLLLTLLLEPQEEMSMTEKCEKFLELFGNSLLRSQTEEYLRGRCDDLIQWITNSSCPRDPIWNFSQLKFKERDALEGIFKLWRNKDADVFDVRACWDGRLRHHHGVRYDAREGTYDWDYSMRLKQKTKIVRWQEYKYWREHGIAFRKRDETAYTVPNKTLASGVEIRSNGEGVRKRGYWGDIVNGPFYSFGMECENASMLEVKNGDHTKSTTDVAFYNIMSVIYELHTDKPYNHNQEENFEENMDSGVIIEEIEEEEIPSHETKNDADILIPNITVHLLPMDCLAGLHKKSKFQSKFDLVYFSNSMVHQLTPAMKPLLHNDALLVVETTRFMLDLKDDMHAEYVKKISAMALNAGCEEAKSCDPLKDNFAFFKAKLS